MADWQSSIAGERMAVDGEFSDRVRSSSLSSQQWDMVMTAVTFEIENPRTPEDAELVADTSRLSAMMDEIERVGSRSPVGGGTGGAQGSDRGGRSDGFLAGLFSTLGMGGGSDDRVREEAEELAAEYADALQAKLIERGRWNAVCELAASG